MNTNIMGTNRHILGNSKSTTDREAVTEILRSWRHKLGYLSLFAVLPAIATFHVEKARAIGGDRLKGNVPGNEAMPRYSSVRTLGSAQLYERQSRFHLSKSRQEFSFISELAGGADDCPGRSIAPGQYPSTSPFTDSGDTTSANNTVGGIGSVYWDAESTPGRDQVYSFVVLAHGPNARIQVSATSLSSYRPFIYLLSECPAGTDNWVENVAGRATAFAPDGSSSFQGAFRTNSLFYLFIDALATGPSYEGSYTLRIEDMTIGDRRRGPLDFSGDARSDISVYRPTEGNWYLRQSDGNFKVISWGSEDDRIVPGDYEGDGKLDAAVWRRHDGTWYIVPSSGGNFRIQQWGRGRDIPVTGDFDGDARHDLAVFRPDNSNWYIYGSGETISVTPFGRNGDVPVPADFTGDGVTDLAVYRNGQWFIRESGSGRSISFNWGIQGDIPVPMDYNGDTRADVAIWRPSEGKWYLRLSQIWGGMLTQQWGQNGDVPVPGDYDGDGRADFGVYRNGEWYLLQSSAGISVHQWGIDGDMPVPAANWR